MQRHTEPWQVGETVGSLTVERLLGRGAYGEAEQLNHKLNLVLNVSGPGYTNTGVVP